GRVYRECPASLNSPLSALCQSEFPDRPERLSTPMASAVRSTDLAVTSKPARNPHLFAALLAALSVARRGELEQLAQRGGTRPVQGGAPRHLRGFQIEAS